MIDRRRFHHLDFYLIFNILAIFGIGILNLVSATKSMGSSQFVYKQIIAFLLGVLGSVIILIHDYRDISSRWPIFYAFCLGLLILVFFLGSEGGGAKRWINVFGFSLQPSEFMKPTLVLLISKMISEKLKEKEALGLKDIALPILLTLIPSFLIFKQPDLGSASLLVILCMSMILFAGIRLRVLFLIVFFSALLGILGWEHLLQPYQKARILGLIHPEIDPSGLNYHAKQAMIAIGSGKFLGKGYLEGTQHRLRFVPEHHTDFVFAVFAEEWGFFGSIVLLLLFASLILRCIDTAKSSTDDLGSLISFGVAATIFWQVVINLLMSLRLFPVVGVPLPLMSYGGSNVLSTLLLFSLVLNVSTRKYMF